MLFRSVALSIDELPVLFIAAACAEGRTVVTGAGELRHKESDRLAVMAAGLRTLGVMVDEQPDGLTIDGGPLSGGSVESHGDHRIAMAFAIASLRAREPIEILGTGQVATSFPGFLATASHSGLRLDAITGSAHGCPGAGNCDRWTDWFGQRNCQPWPGTKAGLASTG